MRVRDNPTLASQIIVFAAAFFDFTFGKEMQIYVLVVGLQCTDFYGNYRAATGETRTVHKPQDEN